MTEVSTAMFGICAFGIGFGLVLNLLAFLTGFYKNRGGYELYRDRMYLGFSVLGLIFTAGFIIQYFWG